MKNLFNVIFIIFLWGTSFAQDWVRTDLPTTDASGFRGGIYFINADIGWMFNARYNHTENSAMPDKQQVYKTDLTPIL